MIHFWLIILLLNSYAFGSLVPDKQPTGSGSGSARSASAYVKTTADTATALTAPKKIPAKPNWGDLSAEQKAEVEAVNKQLQTPQMFKQKQPVIEKAINEGIHPDLLMLNTKN